MSTIKSAVLIKFNSVKVVYLIARCIKCSVYKMNYSSKRHLSVVLLTVILYIKLYT